MKIVARVQHHPSRADLLDPLLELLQPLPVQVCSHASHPPNPWHGYRLCLESFLADSEATHGLVIQDDTIPCRNFAGVLEQIALHRPNVPVALFLAHLPRDDAAAALRAMKRGVRYVRARGSGFAPVVAVLWPREKATSFLEWSRTAKLPGWPGPTGSDDAVLGHWVKRKREEVLLTVPSLVEHPDNVKSIWGRRAKWGADRGRIALQFIGEQDPLELDWS